jgi:HD-like signal output (HDOD) protein
MTLTAERLVSGCSQVASLPDLYQRLNDAIDAPNTPFSAIARIVSDDTGFTARLLRIANSALYSFPSRIETVERAMSIIGTRQLRELALATTVIRLFNGLDVKLVSMESFWRHSLCCGAAARVIATARREINIERFFTLGMLHDIGRLVMYHQIPGDSARMLAMARDESELLYRIEQRELGFTHADVGRLLLANWRLPPAQVEAVGNHHASHLSLHYPLETAAVHIADVIANALQIGSSGEELVPSIDAEAWRKLELPVDQLETVVEHAASQAEEAARLFIDQGEEQ